MKIFGEELGTRGRWYIAVPAMLSVGFLIGLFFVAAAGQTRLNDANARVHESLLRQQALVEFVALVTDAESAQRGYLLTGESAYLAPYRDAVDKLDGALEAIHQSFGDDQPDEINALHVLTGKKLAELESSVALYARRGTGNLLHLGTDAGRLTMDDLVHVAEGLRVRETQRLALATASWQSDYRWSRVIIGAGAVLNIALVLLGARLVYGDMRRRAAQATHLRDQADELERQVQERTQALATLSTHLQGVSEQEKSALSRELHDELGGLLVAARMDVSWLQQKLPSADPAVVQRFKRIHESLSAGVDLKRRVVEELRPTLLDNMGLYTALRWQFREACRRGNLAMTELLPEGDPACTADAAITIFRIAQESLTNILKHAEASAATMEVRVEADTFMLQMRDNGRGLPANPRGDKQSHGLAAMRLRAVSLGGECRFEAAPGGGTQLTAVFPLKNVLAKESPAE